MKRIFVASLVLSLFIGLPAAMSAPLDSITEKLNKTAQDRFGIDTDLFIQTMDLVDHAGTYYVFSDDPGGINTASITPTKEHSRFSAILLPCLDSNLNICIDSVSYKEVTSTNWKTAKLVTPINLSRTGQVAMTYQDGTSQNFGSFSEDLSNNRPAGGNASVWSMEGAQHKGGDEYFVSAGVSNFPSGYRQDPLDLNIAIKPIRVTTPGDVRQYGFPNNVRQYQFPEKIEYRVSIRLGTLLPKLSKWYSARLGSPSISIRGDLLEVSGTSVMVPLARSLPIPCTQVTPEQKNALSQSFQLDLLQRACAISGVGIGARGDTMDNGVSGFQVFRAYENDLFEIGKNSGWNLAANFELGECNSEDISGFVSSNAMIFTPNPPAFDKSTQTLNYQMASVHLDRNGTANVGNLDIFLKKSVAKCLWKTDNIDLYQAVVTIIYATGESVVGTSKLTTNQDWIHVNVTNFTFSNPTFKIMLTSNPPVAKKDNPNPSPESSVAGVKKVSKSIIICVKGRVSKKVTGLSPKCPTGFKRK